MKSIVTKQNIIFAVIILLLAGILFGIQTYNNNLAQESAEEGSPNYAQVHISTSQGNIVLDYSLDEDGLFDVETEWGYTVHLEVADGAIRFIDSPCPDHVCESYGWISNENQFAICAPSTVTILIAPKEEGTSYTWENTVS